MTLAETIEATADLTLGESLPLVVEALRTESIVLPLEHEPKPDATATDLPVADDRDGNAWVYVYSSDDAARAAGFTSSVLFRLSFLGLLTVLRESGLAGSTFGGVMIDGHEPRGSFPIPEGYFESIEAYLSHEAD